MTSDAEEPQLETTVAARLCCRRSITAPMPGCFSSLLPRSVRGDPVNAASLAIVSCHFAGNRQPSNVMQGGVEVLKSFNVPTSLSRNKGFNPFLRISSRFVRRNSRRGRNAISRVEFITWRCRRRRPVLSNVCQFSRTTDETTRDADSNNRWLSRMPRHYL